MEENLEERRTLKMYFQERFIFQIRENFSQKKSSKRDSSNLKGFTKMFLEWKRKRDNSREKDEHAKTKNEKKQFAIENSKTLLFLVQKWSTEICLSL